MSSLFSAQPKIIPEFTGLQVNTAIQALPVPIIYGSPRIDVNLIYYNGFNVQLVSTGGGGKGILGGGKGGNKEVEYFATIVLALGEGPLGSLLVIYQDQGVFIPSDYPSPGLNYFQGTQTQTAWGYVVDNWPNDVRSYKDTAYLAVANAEIDASATIPQINLVVEGLLAATCPLYNTTITITTGEYDQNGHAISYLGNILLGDCDADPALVIYDFLTNGTYGAGFPPALIDVLAGNSLFSGPNALISGVGDAALQTYCQAVGFGWSTVINNVESANSILDRWTKNLVVAPVWTGELLKFIPYWDRPNGANPGYDPANPYAIPLKYFTPNTTPIASLTVDHLLQAKEKDQDPITFQRVNPMTVYNSVRVDFADRYNFFNDNVAEAKDEANIELFGPRVDNVGMADEFTLGAYAQTSATIKLRRNVSIRRKFTFRLGPLWAFLDPMDIIQIPDPANWANIIDVRIISCEDDAEEITTYIAEEFPLGAASPTVLPISPTTPPNQGATNAPAAIAFPPIIFEPTSAMLTAMGVALPEVILGVSGGRNGAFDKNWGGCIVWVSLNGVHYENVGEIKSPSALGQVSNGIGVGVGGFPGYSGANPDNVDTLQVSMVLSGIALPNYPSVAAATGKSICIIKDFNTYEILSYVNATLVAPNVYNLTSLYRGLYGTTASAFNPGSQFLFMGFPTFFSKTIPPQYIGKTVWIKLQGFNVFRSAVQDLSTCVAYEYAIGGPTFPPPQGQNFVVTPERRRRTSLAAPRMNSIRRF